MSLARAEREQLDCLLRECFGTFLELRDAMLCQLDRKLDDYVAPAGMKKVVVQLIDDAGAEGWVADLWQLRPAQQLDNQLIDLAFFDLDTITTAFSALLFEARQTRLLGAVLLSGESGFFDRACTRMATLIKASPRPAISLDEGINTPDRALSKLESYRKSLRFRAELCPIRADSVTNPATVAALWSRVHASFTELENQMVLLFSFAPGTALPQGLCVLPEPQFAVGEVDLWARRLAESLQWSDVLRSRFVESIMTELDGKVSDDRIFTLYRVLEDEIRQLSDDQKKFTARFAA